MADHNLSVLIADDEPRIIQLINQLIDWNELSLYAIGEANDGLVAKEMLETLKPDILITDIRMPGISGLELAKYAKQMSLGTQVIIISGYKQFDYAYHALKYCAVDFLIKPINKRDLNNVLLHICEQKSHVTVSREYIDTLRQKLDVAEQTKRQQFLRDSYYGAVKENASEKQTYFMQGTHMAIAVKADLSYSFSESDTKILEKIENLLHIIYEPKCTEIETIRINDTVLCVISTMQKDIAALYRLSQKGFGQIKTRLEAYKHLALAMAVSRAYEPGHDIAYSMHEAVETVLCKCVIGNKEVIFAEKIRIGKPYKLLERAQEKQIQQYVEALDGPGLCKSVRELAAAFEPQYGAMPWQLRSLMHELLDIVKKKSETLDPPILYGQWKPLEHAFGECTSFQGMQNAMCEHLESLFGEYEESKRSRESAPIRAAKQYIQQNMQKAITLDDIADAVNLSKNYLCLLFKKEMDTTIVSYITDVRMETAKSLLKDTMLNISEIADRVGYQDPKYFSKQFTRTVGIKPKEFRRIHS
ncbi:MAG TPA: response regulator [Feifaniaceae bacterium]|nr:response regulator [Feifaniaceae bacterium]